MNLVMPQLAADRALAIAGAVTGLCLLPACSTMGSLLSPYPEKFSCKNDDHGQCIHPERAYEDARAGVSSKSDPRVTNDKTMLRSRPGAAGDRRSQGRGSAQGGAYEDYRASVYRELKGLIEAPVTPMLKAPRTVRTLILPYSDRARPDRLYMPRYVYSVLGQPVWTIGNMLSPEASAPRPAPLLTPMRETAADTAAASGEMELQP